jgi:hypothetical protein
VLTFRANGRMRMGDVAVRGRVIRLRRHSCYAPTRHCLRSASSCATVALDDGNLRQGQPRRAANDRPLLAGTRRMNGLRQALTDYLAVRRVLATNLFERSGRTLTGNR